MSERASVGTRLYRLTDGPAIPPSYDRVTASLSDQEIAEEIDLGRGSEGYQEALVAEQAKRERRTK